MPFFTRFFFAFATFFRILFDGAFAERVALQSGKSPARLPSGESEPPASGAGEPGPRAADKPSEDAALALLALLQREGRLVDFLQQDIESFSDAEIGAAARAVHSGCRKALSSHATIVPVRNEAEGSRLTLEGPIDAARVKLTGNVGGSAPFHGTLRHRGWQAEHLELPERVEGHDVSVLAPAEVEL